MSSSTHSSERARGRPHLIPWYVGGLVAATGVGAAVSDHQQALHSPGLLALLVALLVALDTVRIDMFERGHISPGTVPAIALAYLFGPFGPICGELAVLLGRTARRNTPAVKQAFDFGTMSLAGIAASAVFAVLPAGHAGPVIVVSVVAALAYYAVNSVLLALVWRLDEGINPVTAWRERSAWLWPHTLAAGAVGGLFVIAERSLGLSAFVLFFLPLAMAWVAEKQYVERSRTSVSALRASHRELAAANEQLRATLNDNQQLLRRTRRAYVSTITSLARTIEAKDPYTGGHTERVAAYAKMLARELGFADEDLEAVEVGAVIHDIGKIGIPDRILLKPGKLDEPEFEEMRRHPEISSYILGELELPAIVRDMARHHHERYDGKGYPDGLAGKQIPLAARILSVADAFDAMTSDRPYRRALSHDIAAEEIRRHSGSQFCPEVVVALDACLARESGRHMRPVAPMAAAAAMGLS